MRMGDVQQRELFRLIADDYVARILSATYNGPLTIQQISYRCGIPIAMAYRRVAQLEESGLLKCAKEEEGRRGRRIKYFSCAVRAVNLSFQDGAFSLHIDPLS